MPEKMPEGEVLSEDQPLELDNPPHPTDVAAEFEAMTETYEPPEHIAEPEPVEPEPEEEEEEPEVEEEVEEADEEEEPDPSEELREEIKTLKAEVAAFRSGRESEEAREPQRPLREVLQPFQPQPPQELMQDRRFLGLVEEPAAEYEAVMGVPPDNQRQVVALNQLMNRVRKSVILDMYQVFPTLFAGNMTQVADQARMDEAFWEHNKDLADVKQLVVSLGRNLLEANPDITVQQFNRELETTVRQQLKRERPTVKSGGTKKRTQTKGRRKPALAGGTGGRKQPKPKTQFQKEWDDLLTAEGIG
jgi:hypothetical protein